MRRFAADHEEWNEAAETPFDQPALYGTKAEVLRQLSSRLSSATVLPSFVVQVEAWRTSADAVLARVYELFSITEPLIVRSSRKDEGVGAQSHAGAFLSVAGVVGAAEIASAIESVINSYGRLNPFDEVLIQPFVDDLDASGVATNYDIHGGRPYIIVNLSNGADSSIVTGGRSGTRTFCFVRSSSTPPPRAISSIITLVEELERFYPGEGIDLEFGVRGKQLYLFQCRALIDGARPTNVAAFRLLEHSAAAAAVADDRLNRSTREFGATALGVMPDWNPAEMIGLKPTPLAFDLYSYLITDSTWATARHSQGYSDIRGTPLMHKIGGTPYIDVGASLASFVPAHLPRGIRDDVVRFSIERLNSNRHLHDKVEFDILATCYRPDVRECGTISMLPDHERELYYSALMSLTNDMIEAGGSFDREMSKVAAVEDKFERLRQRPIGERPSLAAQLHYVRNNVAPLFARVARAAFVATDIVRDLERHCIRTGADATHFAFGSDSIFNQIMRDHAMCSQELFLRRHGHVRPGTYDIRVPSYQEAPELYFSERNNQTLDEIEHKVLEPFLTSSEEGVLSSHPYKFTGKRFAQFAHTAIKAREYIKYLYAGFVSEAMSSIVEISRAYNRNRDDLAFMRLDVLLNENPAEIFGPRADRYFSSGRRQWELANGLKLPGLMFNSEDIFSFEDLQNAPNFVTSARIVAELISAPLTDISGRIVLIEQADPGFDWIFTHNIAGLITAYGGANSHMAVRCRERNLPSAIGVGPALFTRLHAASRALIDGSAQRVEVCG